MKIIKIDVESEEYPQRLLKIKNFPTKIYAMGNIDLLNTKYTVAIVGSRICSEYGIRVTNELAKKLSEKEICVVSGMAIGIDGIAHNAAIKEIGKTIAVLGSGFNYIYPEENEWLFHKILENGGCIVSEYPPDTEENSKNFPIRNRIISGLSDAVVVVEAAHRSGSTITAKYAKKESKTVFAVPNNIYAKTGVGTNRLIQEGAILLSNPDQIIQTMKSDAIRKNHINEEKETNKKYVETIDTEEYTNVRKSTIHKNSVEKKKKKQYINNEAKKRRREYTNIEKEKYEEEKSKKTVIPKEYLAIYKVLSDEPMHINELAKKLTKSVQEIIPIITMMEISEYIYQPQTNYFIRNIYDGTITSK